jgi:DNA-binding GntR family transcriptional regulator
MAAISTAPASSKTFMRDDVYQCLRAWIIDGTLEPEEKLRDLELATQLGVSRTPVREALRRLCDEGLVETKQNAWTRVAAVPKGLAARIYPILGVLEPLALRLAASKIDAAVIASLRRLNNQVQLALEVGDAKTAALTDSELHWQWLLPCDNPELLALIAGLKTQHIRLELAYWRGGHQVLASIDEHQQIIAALEADDNATAQAALLAHWQRANARWEQL